MSVAVRGGGAKKVKPHEFPFFAYFYNEGKWFRSCGGALISTKHVLSCRHCFDKYDSKNIEVGFGKTLPNSDKGVVKRKVQNIAFHPKLDFAILVLKAKVPLSEHVKTIRLPDIGSDYTGQKATLAGPGFVEHEGRTQPWDLDPKTLLMKVTLKVGSSPGKACPDKMHVCATSLVKGKKPGEPDFEGGCDGDSGSPLFICSTPDNCTIIAVIIGPPPYAPLKPCTGDSYGPSVSALRPFILDIAAQTWEENYNNNHNNNNNNNNGDYIYYDN